MKEKIRGITCSLYNNRIGDFLIFLSNEPYTFYMPWCLKIGNAQQVVPAATQNIPIMHNELKQLSKDSIWEIVLHMYPSGTPPTKINTYDDFEKSLCVCCLIFYDCGLMDIYVKDTNLLKKIETYLISSQVVDMDLITDKNDCRVVLYP